MTLPEGPIHFTVVQNRSRINFWCGTPTLAGRLVNDDFDRGHVGDVLPVANVQLRLIASAMHSILEAANQLFRQRTTDSFASRTASECLTRTDAKQVSYEEHRVAKPWPKSTRRTPRSSSRPHCCFRSLRALATTLHLDCCAGITSSACLQSS